MPIELHHLLAGVVLFSIGWAFAVMLPWLILLTIFTPKSVMNTYFKEPHFTLTETYMLRRFPGSFLRTGMFGSALLWPKRAKNRKLDQLRGNIPLWFDWNARLLVAAWLLEGCILIILMPLLYFVEPIS